MNRGQKLPAALEAQNFREFLQLYNSLTEFCFNSCVHTASSARLSADENKCLDRCAAKLTLVDNLLAIAMKYNYSY